jgi:O-methyltransferase
MNFFSKTAVKLVQRLGYTLTIADPVMESDPVFNRIYSKAEKFTMTTKAAMFELYKAIQYVIRSGISGDFVECGVWKGGSAMVIALTLKELNASDRNIYLYDTYEGMSEPTEQDFRLMRGKTSAQELMDKSPIFKCVSKLDEVKGNLFSTGYPGSLIHFIQGKVEDTIPGTMSSEIALLRLDTDWYESTYHELVHLYPLLKRNGVIFFDDYGYWAGHKKAVDEYFENRNIHLVGIASGVRVAVKTE